MTVAEMQLGSERLQEMREAKALPEDIISALTGWWNTKLREEENKVVSLDEWRVKRRWFV